MTPSAAVRGQHAATASQEQRRAELLFQSGNLSVDAGGGEAEALGRAGKAPRLERGEQVVNVFEIHL